ncbi:MAG: ATP-binding protein [Bacteroidia bacterium]
MNDLFTFFKKLFDASDWPPLWKNGNWNNFDGWFYIISDLMIWSAFVALPVILVMYVTRKNYSRFQKLYLLAAAFIFLSGLTYFMDAVSFWYPMHRFNALLRFITGLLSWVTVFSLIQVIPAVLKFRSARELSLEVEQYKNTEELLRIKNQQLNEAQEIARMGHWEWHVASNALNWSHGLFIIYGLNPEENHITFEAFISLVHPGDRTFVNSLINTAFNEKKFTDFYHRICLKSGEIKTIFSRGEVIIDKEGNVIKMIGTGQDVTREKKTEEELLQKTRKLEMINNELQKFAYITSHDLQEPLRKILTFSSRLQEEIKHSENSKGILFIEKITSSTARMQRLIDDVLRFSKLSDVNNFNDVDLKQLVGQVINDMEVAVEKTGAVIHVDELPHIDANASQIGQLFQNMLSNALKFQSAHIAPVINISSQLIQGNRLPENIHAKLTELYAGSMVNDINYLTYCCITISDNGIGFDQNYADKIFEVFQRLTSAGNYEGTGIGLAICKKIVQNHQGIITATSKPGNGATFIITLPLRQTINETINLFGS